MGASGSTTRARPHEGAAFVFLGNDGRRPACGRPAAPWGWERHAGAALGRLLRRRCLRGARAGDPPGGPRPREARGGDLRGGPRLRRRELREPDGGELDRRHGHERRRGRSRRRSAASREDIALPLAGAGALRALLGDPVGDHLRPEPGPRSLAAGDGPDGRGRRAHEEQRHGWRRSARYLRDGNSVGHRVELSRTASRTRVRTKHRWSRTRTTTVSRTASRRTRVRTSIRDDTGTDPNKWDTDGDGFSDGAEVLAGTDPTDSDSFPLFFRSQPVRPRDRPVGGAAAAHPMGRRPKGTRGVELRGTWRSSAKPHQKLPVTGTCGRGAMSLRWLLLPFAKRWQSGDAPAFVRGLVFAPRMKGSSDSAFLPRLFGAGAAPGRDPWNSISSVND